MRSEAISALAEALAKAQGEMKPAAMDCVNPHFKSKYASLASIFEAIRGPLSKHGLCLTQTFELVGDALLMRSTLTHSSGEWIDSIYPIEPVKNDPQGVGSAITYAKRYALSALVGVVADEDDDANAASVPKPAQERMREPARATPAKAPPRAKVEAVAPAPAPAVKAGDFVPTNGALAGKALKERAVIELEVYRRDVHELLSAKGIKPADMSATGRAILDAVEAELKAREEADAAKGLPAEEPGAFAAFE